MGRSDMKIIVSRDGTVLDFDDCVILECTPELADDLVENHSDANRYTVACILSRHPDLAMTKQSVTYNKVPPQ